MPTTFETLFFAKCETIYKP